MAQFEYVIWLLYWLMEMDGRWQFEWDDGNSKKSLDKHGVDIEVAESVFLLGMFLPLGKQIKPLPANAEARLGLLGVAFDGQLYFVSFTLRSERVRVISVRKANRKEREFYEEASGKK